jgi:Fic family protein
MAISGHRPGHLSDTQLIYLAGFIHFTCGQKTVTETRKHETSHPWLTFRLDVEKIPAAVWILLGEARSKCEHLAGVPLQPKTAQTLNQVFLTKGARATTAIEGNTLTEDQVRQQIEGTLKLPPSKQYLAQEVQNILDAFNGLFREILSGQPFALSVDRICAFNAQVLSKLDTTPEAQPGKIRSHSVGVMGYRGAPAEDCQYLLQQLASWLNDPSFQPDAEHGVIKPILAAVLSHLYLAWIHPFGDGNGRTARLVELAILVSAGVPMPAAHLLSNHYNDTRSEYYRQLDMASRSGGDVYPFVRYAMQGFVDGLRDQINLVRDQQLQVAWINFVYDRLRTAEGGAAVVKRRRELLIEMSAPERRKSLTPEEISLLSPHLARLYADRTQKTLRRDLNELKKLELVVADGAGRFRAYVESIAAFLPARRSPESSAPTVRQG